MFCEDGVTAMTHETHKPSDGAERELAAMADQWVDKNWYLPPGGDQSWRDREARRLFGGDNNEAIGEQPPVGLDDRAAGGAEGSYQPGFKRTGALGAILPVSLAACIVLFVGAILVPRVLTPDFWGPREPKTLSATPVRMTNVAAEENATLRPAYEGGNRDTLQAVRQALPQPLGQAVTPADRDIALPLPRPSITAEQGPPHSKPVVRAVKAEPLQTLRPKGRVAKALPPIGATYFESHERAKMVVDSSRPIGQAYFESHSPAVD